MIANGRRLVNPFVLLIVLVIAGGLTFQVLALEISVSPPRLALQVEPGKTVERVITVGGRFERPTRIRVVIGDWGLEAGGSSIFKPAGSTPRTLAGWVTVSPAEFVLTNDGRVQNVHVRLQAPVDAVGGYWGVLFFQNVPEPSKAQTTMASLATVGRLATTVYAETKQGAIREGKVTAVTARWLPHGHLLPSATFINTGNVMLTLKCRFELREPATGKVSARIPFPEDLRVLPGGTRTITATWQGRTKSGDSYLLVALVDYGGRNIVAGQRVIKVP